MKTGTEMLHIIYVMRMTGWCENFTSDCCNYKQRSQKEEKKTNKNTAKNLTRSRYAEIHRQCKKVAKFLNKNCHLRILNPRTHSVVLDTPFRNQCFVFLGAHFSILCPPRTTSVRKRVVVVVLSNAFFSFFLVL